jgi:hypothetical protein
MQWICVCSEMYTEHSSLYLDIRNNYGKKFTSCTMFLPAILVQCDKYECLVSDARQARGKAYRPLRKVIIKIHLSWWKL